MSTKKKSTNSGSSSAKIKYLSNVPVAVPAGEVLVHNHVTPNAGIVGQRLGARGFRAWLAVRSTGCVKCDCGFAKHIKVHYRPDLRQIG